MQGRGKTGRSDESATAFRSNGIRYCTSLFTLDNEVNDDVVEYINLRHQTASLSHNGTSFYLRIGSLGTWSTWLTRRFWLSEHILISVNPAMKFSAKKLRCRLTAVGACAHEG